jgi:ligand-binding sensor domain-containing protein
VEATYLRRQYYFKRIQACNSENTLINPVLLTLSVVLLTRLPVTKRKIFSALLCFITCHICAVHAQPVTFNIRYHDETSGLTSGNIRQVLQDPFGYIWIATQDGLFRYDSRRFIPYNTKFTNFEQIGGADVRNIQIDKEHNLIWLTSSYGGINAIDLLTTKVVKYLPQEAHPQLNSNLIKSFFVTGEDIFLGCERGFYKLDRSGKNLVSISVPNVPAENAYIDYIAKIQEDQIVIFCRDIGIFIYDVSKNIFIQQIFIPRRPEVGQELRFYHCAISTDSLMLITSSYGLMPFRVSKTGLVADSSGKLDRKLKALKNYTVRRAVFDKKGHLWLATSGGIWVDRNDTLTAIRSNDEKNEYLDWLKAVYAMYVDNDNNIWLGCLNGLAYLQNYLPAFVNHSYSAATGIRIIHSYYLFPASDSIVYSTAEEGLYKVNKRRNIINVIKRGRSYDFMFKDPFGRYIVSNINGLFILKDKKEILVSAVYPELKNFIYTRINSCIQINDSCLAMGTENKSGVLVWNFKKRYVDHFTKDSTVKLFEDVINNIYLLSKNEFLILSDASLSVFNYRNRTVKRLLNELSTQTPTNIFFDACRLKDTLFVACYGRGVLKLDRQFRLVGEINMSNGLSNNGVYKIIPWKDSALFITTNNGLNIYNSKNAKIQKFFKEDGLHGNSFEETSGNIFGNEIIAGGTNGFTSILPDRILAESSPPLLYISSISMERPNKVRKDTANIFISKYSIPNDVHQTTIYFSALTYENPGKTTFQYKIDGIHQNWISIGNQNFIDLLPLSPGTYKMYVQAFSTNSKASVIREIVLVFLPKWYQTRLFRILVILLIIASAYAVYHVRVSQLKKEHRIRSRLASDLHDDLGSTMNSVKVYANLALIEKSDKYLVKIRTCIDEAIIGIRDIIWVLDASKDDVENLFARVNTFAGPLCDANNISFNIAIDDEARYNKLRQDEKRNLYMMLKEAVNNSIKYSEASKIQLAAKVRNSKLEMYVTDNGKGFDAEKLHEGNGLKNMRHRTKEIKYHIHIQSVPLQGTSILFEKKK